MCIQENILHQESKGIRGVNPEKAVDICGRESLTIFFRSSRDFMPKEDTLVCNLIGLSHKNQNATQDTHGKVGRKDRKYTF
jgi:hypothetical protein